MSKVLVETSARHVHVSEKDLETLFGPGYQLTVKKMRAEPDRRAQHRRNAPHPSKRRSGRQRCLQAGWPQG